MFDLTQTVSLNDEPNVPWEENLRLVNQPGRETYEYFSIKKLKKDQITFEDYKGIFLSKKLKLSSNNFELSIYLHKKKENSFLRHYLPKRQFEYIAQVKNYNFEGCLKQWKWIGYTTFLTIYLLELTDTLKI